MVTDTFGWLAAVLTVVFAWPQALRAWRLGRGPMGDTAGISLGSAALMLQSGALWTVYGVVIASWFITAANASVVAAAAVTLAACRARLRPAMRLALVLVPPAVAALATLVDPVVTGALGVVAAAVMTLPQLALALRSGTSLAGVSPTTYVLLTTNAACWIVYGVGLADPLVVAPNCVTLPASLLILWRRARQKAVAATPGVS